MATEQPAQDSQPRPRRPAAWSNTGRFAIDAATVLGFGAVWHVGRCPVENVKMGITTWPSRDAVRRGELPPQLDGAIFAARQLAAADGWASLWRGYLKSFAVTYLRPAITIGLFDVTANAATTIVKNIRAPGTPDYTTTALVCSAVLAGALAPVATLPIELLRRRCTPNEQRVRPGEHPKCALHYPDSSQAFADAVKRAGPRVFYSGIGAAMLHGGTHYGVFLGSFAAVQCVSPWAADYGPAGCAAAFLAAATSHVVAHSVAMPFERRFQVVVALRTPLCRPTSIGHYHVRPAGGWWRYLKESALRRVGERGAMLAFFDRMRPTLLEPPLE